MNFWWITSYTKFCFISLCFSHKKNMRGEVNFFGIMLGKQQQKRCLLKKKGSCAHFFMACKRQGQCCLWTMFHPPITTFKPFELPLNPNYEPFNHPWASKIVFVALPLALSHSKLLKFSPHLGKILFLEFGFSIIYKILKVTSFQGLKV